MARIGQSSPAATNGHFRPTGRLERTGGSEWRTGLAMPGGMTRTSVTNCPVFGQEAGGGAIVHGIASCRIFGRLN
jgi:hypothetical protein